MRKVYLDNSSTTRLDKKVEKAMLPFLRVNYGNPGSIHKLGVEAKNAVSEARKQIAGILNCSALEIIFTGSGTESDNLAILGLAKALKTRGFSGKPHIITSAIEHKAVLEPCRELEKEGFEVTYLETDEFGMVSPNEVFKAIRPETFLVSVMYANNEIGTIELIKEIAKAVRRVNKERPEDKKIIFHTDACQATGALNLNVQQLGVDMMTLNGSKIYGPKGVGILYKRSGIEIRPLIFGGEQENGLRSGTENVAAIVGIAKALEIADKSREKESIRLIGLRDYFIKNVLEKIPGTKLNGHPKDRLPNNANISFKDVDGEALVLYLDKEGIYVSTGSACTSDANYSYVIKAIKVPEEIAKGTVRFTLGKDTSKKDADYVLKVLLGIIEKLRKYKL
jgi:cysteine desulfurase